MVLALLAERATSARRNMLIEGCSVASHLSIVYSSIYIAYIYIYIYIYCIVYSIVYSIQYICYIADEPSNRSSGGAAESRYLVSRLDLAPPFISNVAFTRGTSWSSSRYTLKPLSSLTCKPCTRTEHSSSQAWSSCAATQGNLACY